MNFLLASYEMHISSKLEDAIKAGPSWNDNVVNNASGRKLNIVLNFIPPGTSVSTVYINLKRHYQPNEPHPPKHRQKQHSNRQASPLDTEKAYYLQATPMLFRGQYF